MASLVFPSLNVIGTATPVNLDEVSNITREDTKDLNDKSLNRYYIHFDSTAGRTTWSYYIYEDRDSDYNSAVAIGSGVSPIPAPRTETSDFIVTNLGGLYLVDCSAGDVIVYLDPTALEPGRSWNFKKVTQEGSIIFTPTGGVTIDDQTTQSRTRYNTDTEVTFDGINFKIT